MRRYAGIILLLAAVAGCSRAPEAREYELKGQILAVRPERSEVLIRHEDIKGFMPGMTMPFKVKDLALIEGAKPGDLVTATLVVADVEAHLSSLTRTGHTPLDEPAPAAPPEILEPGDLVPADVPLVNQDGAAATLSSFRGHRVALTFIYTRCPLPDFCPLMDRHFAAVQKEITSTPALADVRLVTMTLDPEYDTPPVLKPYAARLGADPAVWSFLTGTPADVARVAGEFGLYVERTPGNAIEITHNLRTAVLDADGRVVKLHTGNSWTPAELLADLKATPAPRR